MCGTEEALWDDSLANHTFYVIQTEDCDFPFTREDFDADTDIQKTLALVGLDPDKFWQAVLFIHALTYRKNTGVLDVEPSQHELISDFIDALWDDDCEVTVSRPAKRTMTLESKTRYMVAYILQYGDQFLANLRFPDYIGGTVLTSGNTSDTSLRWRIFDEYNAYKAVFKKYCNDADQPKRIAVQDGSRDKDLLISRLLFLTGIVDDEAFLESRDRLRGIIDKCKKARRPNVSPIAAPPIPTKNTEGKQEGNTGEE